MENEGSRSNGSGDSYIGSLISLTSKSDIRYEGVLFDINSHDSTIGLRNVRSFGTEGRTHPHIPPSDKVYEYILFRGSDIKDLQVKSSPSVQTTPIHDDPAIIQSSHYPPLGPTTTTSLPPAATVPVPDLNSHTSQPGVPKPTFQASSVTRDLPNLPPPTNATELAMQMYWQRVYGPPGGLQAQQPSFLQPPQGPIPSMPTPMPPMNVLPQNFQAPPMLSNVVIPMSLSLKEGLPPTLVTPGQFLQPGPTTVSSYQSPHMAQKNVEVAKLSSSEPPVPISTEAHAPPILPPPPLPQEHKLQGDASQSRQFYRGERERGRDIGISRPETNFTEEFDFTAMNEKFNKDEVWGDLGKSNKPQDDEYGSSSRDEYNAGISNTGSKVQQNVYVKDDFFDSISCNAFGRGSSRYGYGRTRFSEQVKLDTETFGDFPRFQGGRGNPSHSRGGGYYGRGYGGPYGYGDRGRGRGYNYY